MRPALVAILALIAGCGGRGQGNPDRVPGADPDVPVVSEVLNPGPAEPDDSQREISNSIGMRMNLIPAGEFLMGSSQGERNRSHAVDRDHPRFRRHTGSSQGERNRRHGEGPQHSVQITHPYYLGIYEVTQEDYERVVGTNPSCFKDLQNPVEQLTWGDAVDFCHGLSELPEEKARGHVYRLPTEAEWEYACRAGTTTAYSCGDAESVFLPFALLGQGESERNFRRVGSQSPNHFGLYDMDASVWEWCSDWYGEYSGDEVMNPQGPLAGSFRVLRGGRHTRSAERDWYTPATANNLLGFRVALNYVQ